MSFGKMNTSVEIMKKVIETDDEGFKNERLKTVARVRAIVRADTAVNGGQIWRHFPLQLTCFA